ncbi:PorP/SprF family type IX secretion system membrane protein [Spirosoma utsteinense]|uniref:Type IX secretion system PorP/SprF family membrane protein n=1 Tax=Spirosoma utsteinense TaxID=2585773 RepID=A0ABR6W345_9BACT|nr:type IX secretion system membrane protein PorP/SprF [Spirosoma utsteinense]MBC3783692.1 type IX secretion system PorP/SprF family membrane protein [Spirosoma utsteinense]MBC3790165.1 type IX secretion system PorP/SprF family membrane protein [Spirosoma utsteinense]
MSKHYLLTFVAIFLSRLVMAQDPQFTQFYAAPQYLNPAFAGSALAPRITANYRNQWPAITNYVTTMVGVDHYIEKFNSGVGLLIMNDNQGQGNIQSTEIGLQYAYQFQVSESSFVRLGLQGSYVNRNINYFGLTFGDQYTDRGFIQNSVSGDAGLLGGSPRNKYLDFSTGGLFYSDWFWIGASAHHLNRPSQDFVVSSSGRLPMKGSIHAGLRIPLAGYTGLVDEMDREISFSPVIMYKFQGKYDQLDLGAYLTYSPITIGAYYRGIPFKKYNQTINNHDAVALLAGYRVDKFSIGYSYDATISTLGNSGGSHELSLSYIFEKPEGRRGGPKKRNRALPCPKF